MRLTKKSGYHYYCYGIKEKENKNGLKRQYGNPITKLGQLENLMDKYGCETVEDLDNFIKNHLCKKDIDIGRYKLV